MMDADKTSKPIWRLSAVEDASMKKNSYHPGVASAAVDKPPSDLACSLYHQQTAKAFGKLKERRRISEQLIPCPDSQHLE